MKENIQSTSNPKVKAWSQLLTKKGRQQQGKFLVEGIHLVEEALKSSFDVECVVYDEDRGVTEELKPWIDRKSKWIAASRAVIEKCSDTVNGQGVFAVVETPVFDESNLMKMDAPLGVIIDGLQDPGNLGTIIRSADAAGASYVVVGKNSVDVYNPKTIRSTMGSCFHLPVVSADLGEWLNAGRQAGVQVVSTRLGASENCYDIDYRLPTWIIIGNEGQGVSKDITPYVTKEIMIPMKGQSESLNAAMAATILLYEALRQRDFN
ncbi:TrmH family RNA methyltransferase [Marinicrinis lubricantis]|uniref:TrmH family RNA methyltransferase n=1 Tax=Marinicrinis lubricantis TaxID=2086470 RepID=A0ABW1IJA4_9BACL